MEFLVLSFASCLGHFVWQISPRSRIYWHSSQGRPAGAWAPKPAVIENSFPRASLGRPPRWPCTQQHWPPPATCAIAGQLPAVPALRSSSTAVYLPDALRRACFRSEEHTSELQSRGHLVHSPPLPTRRSSDLCLGTQTRSN